MSVADAVLVGGAGVRERSRSWVLILSGGWIAAIVAVSVFAPFLAPYDPLFNDPGNALQPPSADHWFGTDRQGRDELSRLLYGTRTALFGSIGTLIMSITGGVIVGILAALWGGKRSKILMGGLEVLLSFPSIVLAIILVAAFGSGLTNAMIGLALGYLPITARIVRSQALVQVQEQYVAAAHGLGYGTWRIVWRHLFPNVTSQIIVQASVTLPYAIVDLAALSFLGLGVQPPVADWGNMLAEGQTTMLLAWWPVVVPAVAIVMLVQPWNLFASELRRRLDPRKY